MGVQILKMKWLLILLVLTLQLAVTVNGLTCCEHGGVGRRLPTDGCEIEKTCPAVNNKKWKPNCAAVRVKVTTNVSDINSPVVYGYEKLCNAENADFGRKFPHCTESVRTDEDQEIRTDTCYCLTNLCNKNINYIDGSSNGAKNSGLGGGGGLTSVVVAAAAAVVTGLGRRHYHLIC